MQYREVSIKAPSYRAVSTQYPPIDLFEGLCSPQDFEEACKWEMVTNPRIRNTMMPHEDCVFGNGASYVMAPFFYKTPPARFSTDYFGGYYASKEELTSIYEKAYHLGAFIAATEDEPFSEGLQVLILKGKVNASLHDLTRLADNHPVYDKENYSFAQEMATSLKDKDSNGIVYKSVRKKGGHCFTIFKPKKITIPIVTKKIPLHYDGNIIDRFFDDEKWNTL